MPAASLSGGIAMLQIDLGDLLGDLQIHRGLANRLICAFNQLPGLLFVGSLQARALAGFGVHAIKCSTPEVAAD